MKVRFSGYLEVPDTTPLQDIEDFLSYELGETCQPSGKNALSKTDIMSLGCSGVSVDYTL